MCYKKGFVFIETLITIVVLSAALLFVYSNFNDILIKEKTRIYYDDIAYIYRTYHVKNFFSDFNLEEVIRKLNTETPLIIIGCNYEGLVPDDKKEECSNLINELGIRNIAIGLADQSYIRNCNDTSDKCSYLKNFSAKELSYLATLKDLSENNRYIMIIEYVESEDTLPEIHNYAWIRI